ncbi:hypothetical protein [Natrinema pallidum]|uniref:Uncharacterized protein n=2 Tax=Natrinema pallidum TaxID=69527 RepID=L9YQZ3_9EURY|nr:hypothetical protein [Natrinema pallidum]ELY76640.1 hypothetical protein C487_11167 [Natrinema pallidum DSM 3751]QCW03001.1 hypothetical protein FGF80_07020 [Natrinema pallidum]
MDENHRSTGITIILLGIAGIGIFAVGPSGGSNKSTGIAVSTFFVLCGLFVYWDPDIGELTSASSWVNGLFWIVVGVGIITFVVMFEPTLLSVKGNGIIIGIFLTVIGVYQLIELRRQ